MRVMPAIGAASFVFAADQLSKYGVLELMRLGERGYVEVAPFVNFVLAYNRGVNFGVLAGDAEWRQFALAGFAALVSLALLIWASRSDDRRIGWGAGLTAGGALANAFDRLIDGAVVDFLNVDCCGIGNPYAFNLADVAVFLGAALIVWSAWGEPAEARRVGGEGSQGG